MSAEQLGELRHVAGTLLSLSGSNKTSLSFWLKDREHRDLVKRAVLAFHGSRIPDAFRYRFGTDPALFLNVCTFRHHPASDHSTRVAWHMDVNLVRSDTPFMTTWVALHDVGHTAPGLSFARLDEHETDDRPKMVWLEHLQGRDSTIFFSDEEIEQNLGSYRVVDAPIEAGGAISFEQFTLHRTQLLDNPSTARTSIEFRVFDPRLPPDISTRNAVCAFPKPDGDGYDVIAFSDGERSRMDEFKPAPDVGAPIPFAQDPPLETNRRTWDRLP